MAHFAFVAPPLAGHYDPLQAVAAELVRRGHRATFLHQPDAARLVRTPGIGFVAVGAASHPPGSLQAVVDRMARLDGVFGLRATLADVARATDMLCRELPCALQDLGIDVMIADQTEPAGALVAAHLRLPTVSTATALPLNRTPGLPPPFLDWPFDPSERGQRRAAAGWRVSDWLMRPIDSVIRSHASAWGLPMRRGEDCYAHTVQLAQAIQELDYPRTALPSGFRYLGPFRRVPADAHETVGACEATGTLETMGLVDPSDARPLAFCSLGTLQGSRARLFGRIARAAARLDLRLVIAHGGLLTASQAAALPGRPIVRDFVPQRALLRHAALVVTHAGFNTVLDALACGVPMVAVPLAFEQPATAARLRRVGAARVLSARWSSTGRLVEAMRDVIEAPGYQAAAAALQARISASPGARGAADLIESIAAAAGATTARRGDGDARGDSRNESR